jgi:parallel beta-helix repeat protein
VIKESARRISVASLAVMVSIAWTPPHSPDSTREIYVDGSSGSDANPGSESKPLKTISAWARIAIANYKRNISSKVIIQAGTYREFISLDYPPQPTSTKITFEAVKPGTVTISGADVWTGWQADPSDERRYLHDWPFRWGVTPIPARWPASLAEIVRRREMVFVNGKPLTPVLSAGDMKDGSFYVDDERAVLMIRPDAGIDPAKAVIEVCVRPRWFESHGVSGLTIRGLIFDKANPVLSEAAFAVFHCSDVLVEDSQFLWSNWAGMLLNNVRSSTVRRVVASHNGAAGLRGHGLNGVLYEDDEATYNNWRGAMGNFYQFDEAGGRFGRVHDSTFRRIRSFNNHTLGFWFDTDTRNVTVEDSYFAHNQKFGIFLEANQGPITIENSRICENGSEGVFLNNSQRTTLKGNLIYGNNIAQIFVDWRSRSRDFTDWESGAPFSVDGRELTLLHNTVVAADPGQLLLETSITAKDTGDIFYSMLKSDENTWYSLANKKVFQYDPGGTGHLDREVDFDKWQSRTGQDKNSRFEPPATDPATLCEAP